jgi:hypothetical protein
VCIDDRARDVRIQQATSRVETFTLSLRLAIATIRWFAIKPSV